MDHRAHLSLRRAAMVALLALATSVAACSTAGARATSSPTAGAPTASALSGGSAASSRRPVAVPQSLQGTWAALVSGTTASSGAWLLKVTADNLALHNPVGAADDFFTLDPVSIDGTHMVLPADGGCPDQATVTEGSYTLALSGSTLTFTLVADSCVDRSGVLTKGPWTRQP
jgi:hypothetical protein